MKNILLSILLVFWAGVAISATVQGDSDSNNALDVAKGGTNSTTAANARTTLGVPATASTLAGDCTVGPCLDGTSDGGTLIKFWAGTGAYWTVLQGGASAANRSWRLPIAAAPSAGTTRLMNMDENGQMGFVDPATFQSTADVVTITAGDGLVYDSGTTSLNSANITATKTTTYTIGTDNADEKFGGTIYVTSATTITAPAIATRQNYCVVTIGDIAVSLDVNAADKMILDGVTLADGDKATNTSKSGDTICCQYYSADGQYCWSGTVLGGHWTDGN